MLAKKLLACMRQTSNPVCLRLDVIGNSGYVKKLHTAEFTIDVNSREKVK